MLHVSDEVTGLSIYQYPPIPDLVFFHQIAPFTMPSSPQIFYADAALFDMVRLRIYTR